MYIEKDYPIENNDKAAVLFFHAPWCSQCKSMEQFLKTNESSEYDIISIDVDKFPKAADDLNFRALPAFGFYKDNQLSSEVVTGRMSLNEFEIMAKNKLFGTEE